MGLLESVPEGLRPLVMTGISMILWLFLLTAIFVPLERLFALNRQSAIRPQLGRDIGYFFMTGLIPSFVLAFPLGTIAATSRALLPPGYFFWLTTLPVVAQIAIAFVIGELGFYWGHRIMHQVPWLWRFHATHHEPGRMDWLVNTRAHPIDIIFTRMFGLTLVNIAGVGSPGSGTGSLIPVIVLIVGVFWGFLIHSNLRLRLGWFEHVLSSPRFHHWHHSRDDHPNHNYASMLPIYDRIFGTLHLPKRDWPASYGISDENDPERLIAAHYEQRPTEEPPANAKGPA